MQIRKAAGSELDAIMEIYGYARRFMEKSGNATQWGKTHPERELVREDIAKGQCYVCLEGGQIHGVFVFIVGEDDPTYAVIQSGKWPNERPYGVIHRLAGDGTVRGLFDACVAFCKPIISDIRADTHRDNLVMQHLLEKNGFVKCGVIFAYDGSPRFAYQYTG